MTCWTSDEVSCCSQLTPTRSPSPSEASWRSSAFFRGLYDQIWSYLHLIWLFDSETDSVGVIWLSLPISVNQISCPLIYWLFIWLLLAVSCVFLIGCDVRCYEFSTLTSPIAAGMFDPKTILGSTVKLNGSTIYCGNKLFASSSMLWTNWTMFLSIHLLLLTLSTRYGFLVTIVWWPNFLTS